MRVLLRHLPCFCTASPLSWAPDLAPQPFFLTPTPKAHTSLRRDQYEVPPGSAFKSRLLTLSCEGSSRGHVMVDAEDGVMLPKAKEC